MSGSRDERDAVSDCGVVELRRYDLRPGARETLIELFEREFVETQEACRSSRMSGHGTGISEASICRPSRPDISPPARKRTAFSQLPDHCCPTEYADGSTYGEVSPTSMVAYRQVATEHRRVGRIVEQLRGKHHAGAKFPHNGNYRCPQGGPGPVHPPRSEIRGDDLGAERAGRVEAGAGVRSSPPGRQCDHQSCGEWGPADRLLRR